MDEATPPRVPGFELGALLGAGATSEVWEGVREADGRRVAVKVAHADADAVDAALREAEVAGRRLADHVARVESCLPLPDGRVALVMPLLRGGNLETLVRRRGHLAPGEVVTVLAPVASALGRLHAAGVVHGDLSPGNILFDLDGRPAVADLGLGRVLGEAPCAVWGTEGFVAPEVVLGADPSPGSDVYGLGALGWWCLTGQVPGPPGLRPELAGLCYGEPGPVVQVVASAVRARAEERPSADALAWALFQAAEPVPLHLVDGDDEVSAVTYRLRAAATATGAQVPPTRRRHARPSSRRARASGRVGMPSLLVAVLACLFVGGGLAFALSVGPPVTSAVPGQKGDPAASSSPGAVRSDPSAPTSRPGELVAALVRARSDAWREAGSGAGVTPDVSGYAVPGSPFGLAEQSRLTTLVDSGSHVVGLTYHVAAVTGGPVRGDLAWVDAELGVSEYLLRPLTDGPAERRSPQPDAAVRLRLRYLDQGWRISEIGVPDG